MSTPQISSDAETNDECKQVEEANQKINDEQLTDPE